MTGQQKRHAASIALNFLLDFYALCIYAICIKAMLTSADQKFLAEYDFHSFDRPSVAVDAVILTLRQNQLHALLTSREDLPYKNLLALPGGFVKMSESLEDAMARVLKQKLNLQNLPLEQLQA